MIWTALAAALLLCTPVAAQIVRTRTLDQDFREQQTSLAAQSHRLSRPIALGDAYRAVGVKWNAENGTPTLQLRGSSDGLHWTEWQSVQPSSDTPYGGLVYLGPDIRFLQYDLESPRRNVLHGVQFLLIHPGDTPARLLHRSGRRVHDLPKPALVSRLDWGSPDGEQARSPIQYTTVTHLIIHHTGDSFPTTDYPAWVRAIWAFHVFSNGWIDIGYNFLIDPKGNVYEGRAGGDGALGAHFSCQNGGTMGVALLGTYSNVSPTPEAIRALEDLLSWKVDQLRLDPLATKLHPGTGLMLPVIASHRDGNTSPSSCTRTECPGDLTYALLPKLRNDVSDRVRRIVAPR